MKTAFACKKFLIEQDDGEFAVQPAIVEVTHQTISNVIFVRAQEFEGDLKRYRDEHPGNKIESFEGKIVTPAFVNAHTHIAMSFFRGLSAHAARTGNMIEDFFFHVESTLTGADVRAFARLGAYECLLNGVGFVWDHYYHAGSVANALIDVGLSGAVAPTLQDVSGPAKDIWEQNLAQSIEINSMKRFRENAVFAALGPHATDTVSDTLWKEILSLGIQNNLPIHAHLAQTADEVERSLQQYSCTPVQRLQRLGVLGQSKSNVWAHGIYISSEDCKALKNPQNTMVFCPFSQLIFQFPANVSLWQKQGLRWCVATDCVASNDSMNVQKELRYVLGLPAQEVFYSKNGKSLVDGFSLSDIKKIRNQLTKKSTELSDERQALKMVWSIPGTMHPQVHVGRIAKGMLANFCVWNERHPSLWPAVDLLRSFAAGDTIPSLERVIVAGKILGKAGQSLSSVLLENDTYREAVDEANARLREVGRRAGLSIP